MQSTKPKKAFNGQRVILSTEMEDERSPSQNCRLFPSFPHYPAVLSLSCVLLYLALLFLLLFSQWLYPSISRSLLSVELFPLPVLKLRKSIVQGL